MPKWETELMTEWAEDYIAEVKRSRDAARTGRRGRSGGGRSASSVTFRRG